MQSDLGGLCTQGKCTLSALERRNGHASKIDVCNFVCEGLINRSAVSACSYDHFEARRVVF